MTAPSRLVSVVIPTRDRRMLLPRAVQSVLTQCHRELECIIVDDGSRDGTPVAVRSLDDPRVRLIELPVARGAPHARNVGIEAARGRFVAFLDSDDEWLPGHLRRALDAFQRESHSVAVYSGVEIRRNGRRERRLADTSGPTFERLLAYAWPITTSGIVVDAYLAGRELHFDEGLPAMQEYDLLVRLGRQHQVACVPEVGYVWHWHDGERIQRNDRHVAARMSLLAKHAPELGSLPHVAAYHHYRLAISQRRVGDDAGARRSMEAAVRLAPRNPRYRYLHGAMRLGGAPTSLAWRAAAAFDRLRRRDPTGPLGGEPWLVRAIQANRPV